MAQTAEQTALTFVKKTAKNAKTWADIHTAFYGTSGKFQELFPFPEDRSAFLKTQEHGEIADIIGDKRESCKNL